MGVLGGIADKHFPNMLHGHKIYRGFTKKNYSTLHENLYICPILHKKGLESRCASAYRRPVFQANSGWIYGPIR